MKQVYYAHPTSIYDTPDEFRDIATLRMLGFEVVNPNTPARHKAYLDQGMDVFFKIIRRGCDALAFRAFDDGTISAGVAAEIACAYEYAIPVFELPSRIEFRTLSVDATRIRLARLAKGPTV